MGNLRRRKGEAFPQSKRRSRRSSTGAQTVFWTRAFSYSSRRARHGREGSPRGGEPRPGRRRVIARKAPATAHLGTALLPDARTLPLTGLTHYFCFPLPHGFAVGYMTTPAT